MKHISLYLFLTYCAVLLLFPAVFSYADTTLSIGGSMNQVVNDVSGGFTGEIEHTHNRLDVDVEGQLQFGDIYRGKLTAAVTFDLGPAGIKLQSKNVGKGYELSTMGRRQVLTLGANAPIPHTPLEVYIGLGGKSASPWGAPNLLSDALPLGYDEGVLESIGAGDITPAPRGLPPREVTAAVLFVATEFEKDWLEGDIHLQSEITGDDKGHQAIFHLQTQRNWGPATLVLAFEYGSLLIGGKLYGESAWTTAVNFPWEL